MVDLWPIFNKDKDLNKNYRPVSILSYISKVFEGPLYKQIDNFMASKLSPYLCVFRKNHNSQHSLLKIIEVWKKMLGQRKILPVLF